MAKEADIRIAAEEDANGAVSDEIERRLTEALRQNVPPNDSEPLTIVARDGTGELIGGLVGSTSYGWFLVKMLWVAEDRRDRGLGARIMAEAEALAGRRGCHGAWLDTSSARAERFYASLGYEPFGILRNEGEEQPRGHQRWFLLKRLGP